MKPHKIYYPQTISGRNLNQFLGKGTRSKKKTSTLFNDEHQFVASGGNTGVAKPPA